MGQLANEAGLSPYAIGLFPSVSDAFHAFRERRAGFCSLMLCSMDTQDAENLELLAQFKKELPDTKLVLVSSAATAAMTAYRVRADGFILMTGNAGEFAKAMSAQLARLGNHQRQTITLKTKMGIEVLDADSILFAETSNAGPVIHLANGSHVETRGALQALYDQMAHDERFAKAGGSFIVNLNNVRSAGKTSLVFPDGSVIILPIRARKPLQDALAAYRDR